MSVRPVHVPRDAALVAADGVEAIDANLGNDLDARVRAGIGSALEPEDAQWFALALELIGRRMTESFLVLALSTKNEIIGFHVSRGSMTACPVAAVDVFRYPIIAGASGIIVAHNHPSGRVEPSAEDIVLTRRLREAADLLGIQLLDHIIMGEEAYTSFLDARLRGPRG